LIKKAVIPITGLGTRLLPITKELPKEMLPIGALMKNEQTCLKPMLQAIFEQLYVVGFREFAFVVGRGKRAIEDHFSPDEDFIKYLRNKNKEDLAEELQEFYQKINNSNMVFINQPKPRGFGDAVAREALFTVNENFLMQADDDLIISGSDSDFLRLCPNNKLVYKAMMWFEENENDMFFLMGINNPSLSKFKFSFTNTGTKFYTYRKIHNDDTHRILCRARDEYYGERIVNSNYFP
jgi:UTP-glucose-1-phosphate uridylyltransferase